MKVITYLMTATLFLSTLFPMFPAFAEDLCAEGGILIKNMTMLDLWYRRDDGECAIWIHNHVFVIKPKEKVKIYSDMVCETLYCTDNPSYKDYKAADADGNCRVKILPYCTLSDM
jgi:hypothetical protein